MELDSSKKREAVISRPSQKEKNMSARELAIQIRKESPCFTLTDIAIKCNVSKERVRQILSQEKLPTKHISDKTHSCLFCGKPTYNPMCCSRICNKEYINSISYSRERFMRHVDTKTGCWEWTGSKTFGGYGHARFQGQEWRAHRVSFELFVGRIPDNLQVCHSCDNPPCVNPDHLFLGTAKENILDSVNKGRWNAPKGEQSYWSKLTDLDVLKIRALVDGGQSQKEIATQFKITQANVSAIKVRRTWKHL
jgi:hypothetical protein